MKKIIICSIFTLLLSFNFAQADQTLDLSNTPVPTDAQIMEIINKFDFDAAQKEYLLRETRKQIDEIYKTQQLTIDDEFFGQTQTTTSAPTTTTKVIRSSAPKQKKYAKHDPLIKKRSYGKRLN